MGVCRPSQELILRASHRSRRPHQDLLVWGGFSTHERLPLMFFNAGEHVTQTTYASAGVDGVSETVGPPPLTQTPLGISARLGSRHTQPNALKRGCRTREILFPSTSSLVCRWPASSPRPQSIRFYNAGHSKERMAWATQPTTTPQRKSALSKRRPRKNPAKLHAHCLFGLCCQTRSMHRCS